MTRKDYVLIADVIKDNTLYKPNGDRISRVSYHGLIRSLCDVFKADNERFDADTFKDYISG